MSYTIDKCSWYRRTEDIQSSYGHIPDVYIFEKHQQAFPVWGTYANRNNKPLTLITFDSHTDTITPGSAFINKYRANSKLNKNNLSWNAFRASLKIKRENFDIKDVITVTKILKNDEQIKMAVYCKYIKKVLIFTRAEDEHTLKIDFESVDRPKYDFTYRYVDNNNEADLEVLNEVKDDFILDIDLDFFIKPFDFSSELGVEMRKLMKTAKLITIATEPEWFKKCRKYTGFTNDIALNDLIKVILEERTVNTERTVDKENGDIE